MQFYEDAGIFCWGRQAQGGVYILRMQVVAPLDVQFGRFQNGRLIHVPAGDYLYVGSALGQKGSASLARRLLRHASRSNANNPQPIRQQLLTIFPEINLGPKPLLPPTGKQLRWHVDFLLEKDVVALTAVYLLRLEKRDKEKGKSLKSAPSVAKNPPRQLETAVARYLLNLPEVTPLVPGLGSTDDPGGTHLLSVTAVSEWWSQFPAKLNTFLGGDR